MGQTDEEHERNNAQRAFNLTLAVVASQAGCLTVVIIVVALIAGLWLDSRFDTKPTFTIILLVGSVPFTLAAMFWVVRNATSRMKTTTQPKTEKILENVDRGTNT